MNQWVIPVGVAAVLLLGGMAVCLFLLYRAHAVAGDAGRHAAAVRTEFEQRLEAIAVQVEEIRQEPAAAAVPSPPLKPGFNLTKRSQALRMHRRGDPPEQIASALDIPYQEIELLLKVHRIVLSSL